MMMTALRVAALCASTHALQMTSRRRCLHGLGGAALMTTLAPRGRERAAPAPDELRKLTLGYQRADAPPGLAEDHGRLLRQRPALEKEKAQVVATNGGALCDASPFVIQEYIGYKSINDPLYRSKKLMVRAAPLLKSG